MVVFSVNGMAGNGVNFLATSLLYERNQTMSLKDSGPKTQICFRKWYIFSDGCAFCELAFV